MKLSILSHFNRAENFRSQDEPNNGGAGAAEPAGGEEGFATEAGGRGAASRGELRAGKRPGAL